jgi:hypothetical protein
MFIKKKTEVINFRDFLAGNYAQKQSSVRAMSAFFPVITPGSFFPLHDAGFALFLLGGAVIVGSAFFQHITAKTGSTAISETISAISGFLFPVVVYGAIFWFFFTL